ncbi:hypothetical protein NCCP133_38800 [Cytobacillus sp. NCCP-133]|nr:hypothetical protein NCCP133_38800 [Cytobacillus sp. NCCP-133]
MLYLGTEHFAVAYNFTRRVENDEYPARTFRHNYNSGFNARYFSLGESDVTFLSPDGSTFSLVVSDDGTLTASKRVYAI